MTESEPTARLQGRQGLLLADYAGHPFTVSLARTLAESHGLPVTYAYYSGVVSPKGALGGSGKVTWVSLGSGRAFEKYRALGRIRSEALLAAQMVRAVVKAPHPTVVVCNMPILAAAASGATCRITRRRAVLWFQDSQAAIASSAGGPRLLVGAASVIERLALRLAHRVIAISPRMVEESERLGANRSKVALLRNWAPIEDLPILRRPTEFAKRHRLDNRRVFLYSGTLGRKHRPDLLLELARMLKSDVPDGHLLLVSEGEAADHIRTIAANESLPLTVMGYVPASEIPEVMASADVAVVLLDEAASEFSVPSKVWTYMATGRPIVGAMPAENDASLIIREVNCGLLVDADDVAGLLSAAKQLIGDTSLAHSLGGNGRRFAEENFTATTVAERFVEMVDSSAALTTLMGPK